MNLQKVMLLLQTNWRIALPVLICVVIAVYVYVSTRVLLKMRKQYGKDVCMSCYIPIVGVWKLHRVKVGIRKERRKKRREEKRQAKLAKKSGVVEGDGKVEEVEQISLDNVSEDEELDLF